MTDTELWIYAAITWPCAFASLFAAVSARRSRKRADARRVR